MLYIFQSKLLLQYQFVLYRSIANRLDLYDIVVYVHGSYIIATTHITMMKIISRTSRITPTIAPMAIPAIAPSERGRVVGTGGWVVGSIRGPMRN